MIICANNKKWERGMKILACQDDLNCSTISKGQLFEYTIYVDTAAVYMRRVSTLNKREIINANQTLVCKHNLLDGNMRSIQFRRTYLSKIQCFLTLDEIESWWLTLFHVYLKSKKKCSSVCYHQHHMLNDYIQL